MKFRDYYKILGVSESASADEIKRAYRKKARQFHPDVSKENDAEEQFKLVGEAYEVLRDPGRRAEYDQLKTHGYRHGDNFQGGGNWQGQWGADTFSGAGDFSDFFKTIFGAAGAGSGFHGAASSGAGAGPAGSGYGAGFGGPHADRQTRTSGRASPQSGADVRLRVRVSLELAYKGGKTTIKVPSKDGNGQRSLSVTIPAGVVDGQQLRLRDQGRQAGGGGRPGDLIMIIEIKQHDLFEVDGADIVLQLPITPLESIDGVTVSVPTLGGEVSLKIPAKSASGSKLRLRGRGLPASSIGDQYVIVQIAMPAEISAHQRKLLEEFDAAVNDDPRSRLWSKTVA